METSSQEISKSEVATPSLSSETTPTAPRPPDNSPSTRMNWMSQSTVQNSNIGIQAGSSTVTEQGSVHEPIPVSDTDTTQEQPQLPGGMSLEELQDKVKELFPGFTTDNILRFSSLLGPGKQSSMPRLWDGCRKPKRKSRPQNEYNDPNEWTFNFAPPPTDDMLDNDDVDFTAPIDSNVRQGGAKGDNTSIMVDEQTSEWRFGPARYWYDLFGFPEDGRGFDYGFRMKVRQSFTRHFSYNAFLSHVSLPRQARMRANPLLILVTLYLMMYS